jgi:hypothetical protein
VVLLDPEELLERVERPVTLPDEQVRERHLPQQIVALESAVEILDERQPARGVVPHEELVERPGVIQRRVTR